MIGRGEDMIHNDFGFTWSKVKVTRVTNKIWFPLIILRTICHIAFIIHMLIGIYGDMTP